MMVQVKQRISQSNLVFSWMTTSQKWKLITSWVYQSRSYRTFSKVKTVLRSNSGQLREIIQFLQNLQISSEKQFKHISPKPTKQVFKYLSKYICSGHMQKLLFHTAGAIVYVNQRVPKLLKGGRNVITHGGIHCHASVADGTSCLLLGPLQNLQKNTFQSNVFQSNSFQLHFNHSDQ